MDLKAKLANAIKAKKYMRVGSSSCESNLEHEYDKVSDKHRPAVVRVVESFRKLRAGISSSSMAMECVIAMEQSISNMDTEAKTVTNRIVSSLMDSRCKPELRQLMSSLLHLEVDEAPPVVKQGKNFKKNKKRRERNRAAVPDRRPFVVVKDATDE